MERIIHFRQTVHRAIQYTTWIIPQIRDGDDDKWRNINNSHLVVNHFHVNGYDRFEDSIFRAKRIMEQLGWKTEITGTDEWCHEHLYYQHYQLTCCK